MPNETGDLKLLANFRKLIDLVSADPNYKPSNAALKPAALNPQHAAGLAAAQDVTAKQQVNMAAISDRATAFEGIAARFARVHSIAKASGAAPEAIEDLESSRRKMRSTRKPKASPAAPDAPASGQPKERSSAQLSYDNLVGHVGAYLARLGQISSYDPQENDLKLAALNLYAQDLQAKNDAVSATFVPLSQARGLRDQSLYEAETSIVNTALLVKQYVKGALGTQSQLYKAIKGLEFKRAKK